jgi:hypothetical protein
MVLQAAQNTTVVAWLKTGVLKNDKKKKQFENNELANVDTKIVEKSTQENV